MEIKFGTDGWRGMIADEFTYKNVKIVAEGIARYILKNTDIPPSLIVSYDARFSAENFAKIVANVFAKNNIDVYLTEEDTPTPVATFYIKYKNLSGGVIITASHNPPEFLGIKFKPHYAGSATPDETKKIEEEIHSIDIDFEETTNLYQKIKIINPYKAYLKQLKKIVDFKKIKEKKLKTIVDPMHGAGRKYLENVLKDAGCVVLNLSPERDVLFGKRAPEPILKNLSFLQKTCKKEKTFGIAIDGDGDRIGAFDEKGRFLSSHNIGTLLLKYFLDFKSKDGSVVKSINFTSAIDVLAKKYNLKLHIVPVGFKYICEIMRKEKVLLGMEESGGIAFQGHIPERDGILSSLYLIEMIANYNLPLYKIFDSLCKEIGKFYYDRIDINYPVEKIKRIHNYLKNSEIKKICGKSVERVDTFDGFKYHLLSGDWIMIRPSGTEPLLRIYAETREKSYLEKLLAWGVKFTERL